MTPCGIARVFGLSAELLTQDWEDRTEAGRRAKADRIQRQNQERKELPHGPHPLR